MHKVFGCVTAFIVMCIFLKNPFLFLLVLISLLVVFLGDKNDSICSSSTKQSPTKSDFCQKNPSQAVASVRKSYSMPSMHDILYPMQLPTFEELTKKTPSDQRALVYAISHLYFCLDRKHPFSGYDISYLDFGSRRNAYVTLKKAGIIQPLTMNEEIEFVFTRDELCRLLQERNLSIKGKKRILADRLVQNGYRIDRKNHRAYLFRLTEQGKSLLMDCNNDKKGAISRAVAALKKKNYYDAIAAYRCYDAKWGFVHTSGKVHTIFACYELPYSRFECIQSHPMLELYNTADFKETLRACILAGLMRGCNDAWELTLDFKSLCQETINCPSLLSLFDYNQEVLENMQRQIEFDSDNAVQYYISHLLYISRRWH